MISVVIVDDELSARNTLKSILNEFFPEVSIIGEADNPKSAVEIITSVKPMIVFMDIEMQLGTGFDVLDAISSPWFHVIFVTAHKEHAYQSFRFPVIDYIIKPVRITELKRAFEKYKRDTTSKLTEQLSLQKTSSSPIDQLVIPDINGFTIISIAEIVRCEGSRNYTILYLLSGKKITSGKPLKFFEEILIPLRFFRVHRSWIVNLKYISKYTKGRGSELEMMDGSFVPIARERKDELLKNFLDLPSHQ